MWVPAVIAFAYVNVIPEIEPLYVPGTIANDNSGLGGYTTQWTQLLD